MLDTHGYKSTDEDTKQLDSLAREIFAEETGGQNLDTLIGHDRDGNLWIYASEEAKQYAEAREKHDFPEQQSRPLLKALTSLSTPEDGRISRAESEPAIPTIDKSKEEGYSYAKTLRLTSDQLVCFSVVC
jgi:phosphatidate phosphatase LPIN